MRRLSAILASLVLVAAIPAAVSAKKPDKGSDHFVAIFCDGIAPTSGQGFLFLGASISDNFGPDAEVVLWNADSPDGPPDITNDFESPVDASYEGGFFSASFALIDSGGDPAGTAVVEATLTPVGSPSRFVEDFGRGNVQDRVTVVVQPLAAEGTAVIAGKTFDLSGCFAEDTHVSTLATNPASFVERFAVSVTNCSIENADGTMGDVFIDANTDEVFVDAVLSEGPGSPVGAIGSVLLEGGSGSGDLDLYDPETFDPVDGTASIDLSLTAGDSYSYILKDGAGMQMNRGQLIDVEGTLTFPGLSSFDLSDCVAFAGDRKEMFHQPQGPKPTGKAPANDLPAGARQLNVGGKTSQSTRAAALDQEADYSCMELDDPFTPEPDVIPVEHTVWFKVAGTGADVTVDPAGSDFDTVAAAYVADGVGGFEEIACADDTPLDPIGRTLQGSITFPTTLGTTYWVQIGGFPGFQSYGNLRVAVR
jgi:hypothetical protein